jgi:putative flippase GtrA
MNKNLGIVFVVTIQFIKFGLVGGINTIISLAIYYLFLMIDPELYLLGNVTGFVVSTLNAYIWNSKFVFKENTVLSKSADHMDKPLTQAGGRIVKTYISYAISLGLGTALLYFWVQVIEISPIVAPVVNLIITVPLNFCMNKFWVYKRRGE